MFSDETGDLPAGTGLRSPNMIKHQPFVREMAVILVYDGSFATVPYIGRLKVDKEDAFVPVKTV